MNLGIKISSALISVFDKSGLEPILKVLNSLKIKLISTGGTKEFIESLGYHCSAVEEITGYPSIFGGRVKTLHPNIFGGILQRRNSSKDIHEAEKHNILPIDLIIVDLYPFSETVKEGKSNNDIIEKIDIGGVSLIRAAAKNYNDTVIIPSKKQYNCLLKILEEKDGVTNFEERKKLAKEAFAITSEYDSEIFNYFDDNSISHLRVCLDNRISLRYGENPHQKGFFFGNLDNVFDKIQGKEISYNNLLDIDAALSLIKDYDETTCAILKHNNVCGIASRTNLYDAWESALAGDPVSAFGGIIITNDVIDKKTAEAINEIFFEIIIAPNYSKDALEILSSKKNRIILKIKNLILPKIQIRTILNGILLQDFNSSTQSKNDLKCVTKISPSEKETEDLLFANKLVKHTKSNAIILVKDKQLCASGVGQTSRIDALNQAINKANVFKFDLDGAIMASDAFFPFPDCVEVANKAGITSIIQPGGSVKDQLSIDYCDKNNISMVFTGIRHFKH